MLRATLLVLLAIVSAALGAPAASQDPAELETVELRVTSSKPGSASVDRGSDDGLAPGDRVTFLPREGARYAGRVVSVEARSARIEFDDQARVALPGTRGEVPVPRSRRAPPPVETAAGSVPDPAAPAAPAQPGAPDSAAAAGTEAAPGHPPWPAQEDDWSEGEPLLAKVRPVRPEERARSMSGRVYVIADQIYSTEDDREDGFYRAGTNLLYENFFGRGERIEIDGEINYRYTDVPDQDDEDSTEARLDRASYSWGGTRFSRERWEFGRFLQHGMPEFGLLDGAEWGQRLDDGSSWGLSLGYMPEPDKDLETAEDLQAAAWYQWVQDETEQFTAAAGFQKTLHNGDSDRDLVVAKVLYVPPESWTFHGTAWVDLYTSKDDNKGSGPELTQAYANAGRLWENGSSLNLVYSHYAFPEVDADLFTPVADAQLADDHNDRLALNLRLPAGRDTRLHSSVAGWVDQEDEGGDGELGVDVEDLFFDRSLTDLTLFGTRGKTSSKYGARLGLGIQEDDGRWGIDYELATHHFFGFSDNNNDLPQHRLSLIRELETKSGWSFSAHLDASLWDDEHSLWAGIYVQKRF